MKQSHKNRKPISIKQDLKKRKLSDTPERINQNTSKLECYLALNRESTAAEYLSTVTDPKLRKSLTMYRLSEHSLASWRRPSQTDLDPQRRLTVHPLHTTWGGARAAPSNLLPAKTSGTNVKKKNKNKNPPIPAGWSMWTGVTTEGCPGDKNHHEAWAGERIQTKGSSPVPARFSCTTSLIIFKPLTAMFT